MLQIDDGNMMEYLMLAIGDPHIPRRAKHIPEPILEKISELDSSQSFDYSFFTGDLIDYQEFLEFLTSHTKKEVYVVMGNMDYYAGNRDAPISRKLTLEMGKNSRSKLTIGLTHGDQIQQRGNHQQLEQLAKNNNFDILISGHTHQEEVKLTKQGVLLLNPGSVTGAWSFIASGIPSFITLSIKTTTNDITATLLQLDQKRNELNHTKFYYSFQDDRIHEKYR